MDLERNNNTLGYLAFTKDLMDYLPDYFKTVRSNHRVLDSNEASSCAAVSNLFKMHANLLKANGKEAESAKFSQQANILDNIAEAFNRKMNR